MRWWSRELAVSHDSGLGGGQLKQAVRGWLWTVWSESGTGPVEHGGAATMDLAAAELEAAIQRIVDARRQLRAGRLPGVLEDE